MTRRFQTVAVLCAVLASCAALASPFEETASIDNVVEESFSELMSGRASGAADEVLDPEETLDEVAGVPKLRIGIVNYVRPSPNTPVVAATLEALTRRFGAYQILDVSLTMDELESAIASRQVDIFISSAGFYWRTTRLGAVAVASLASADYPNPNAGEGSAFVVLADSPARTLADLKGLRASVADRKGFAAYLLPMDYIARAGYDWENFFGEVMQTGPGDKARTALHLLMNGRTDVAVLRQCSLEKQLEALPQWRGKFRVVGAQKIAKGACRRSTDLYPSWVAATTPSTPPALSKAVVETLLEMTPTVGGHFWSVGTNFQKVDEMYRRLQLGPYEYLRNWTFARVWREYSALIVLVVVLIVGWILHTARVTRLVAVRTAELKGALERERKLKKLAEETNARMEQLQRAGIVGQISSMIAHELRQPLGAVRLYLQSIKRLAQRGNLKAETLAAVVEKATHETERADRIIEDVRAYAKGRTHARSRTNLAAVVREAAANWRATGRLAHVDVVLEADCDVFFDANALEWEIVIFNLIKNAAEACQSVEMPLVTVGVELLGPQKARLTVADNGPTLSSEVWERLTTPMMSSKAQGLGLGLAIVRGIVEAHGARLVFVANRTRGVTARIDLTLGADT